MVAQPLTKTLLLMTLSLGAPLLGCAGAPPGEARNQSPIQGGTPDAADPSVGLVSLQGGGFCTGTLISPSVVLTAGHCVQAAVDGFYTGPGTPQSTVTATPPPGMVRHAADNMMAHPSYQSGTCPNTTYDVGLVHLAQPATDLVPLKLGATPPSAPASCQAVGYGTSGTGTGTTYEAKRSANETVLSVADTSLEVTFGTGIADHGDSGGPLLCNGLLVGATSCHTDGQSPQHKTEYYARLDSALPWIAQTVSGWDPGTSLP